MKLYWTTWKSNESLYFYNKSMITIKQISDLVFISINYLYPITIDWSGAAQGWVIQMAYLHNK